jgi:hypothetical protein
MSKSRQPASHHPGVFCSCSEPKSAPVSEAQASMTIPQTPLSGSATVVSATTRSRSSTTFDLRFICPKEELEAFSEASPFPPDQLEAGKPTVLSSMNQESWWQPDDLQPVNGMEARWTHRDRRVSSNLMPLTHAPTGKSALATCILGQGRDESGWLRQSQWERSAV